LIVAQYDTRMTLYISPLRNQLNKYYPEISNQYTQPETFRQGNNLKETNLHAQFTLQ